MERQAANKSRVAYLKDVLQGEQMCGGDEETLDLPVREKYSGKKRRNISISLYDQLLSFF